jgi:hypothetical protein
LPRKGNLAERRIQPGRLGGNSFGAIAAPLQGKDAQQGLLSKSEL